MSTAAIVSAARGIVEAALVAAGEPSLLVTLGVPKAVNTDTVAYLWSEGYEDREKAGAGWVQRVHSLPIHLMILSTGDDNAAEARLMALSDAIGAAFYTDRKLGGAAATSALSQMGSAGRLAQSEPYVLYQNGEYRHRWWSLSVTEDLVFAFQ